jgi:hypothetical protein
MHDEAPEALREMLTPQIKHVFDILVCAERFENFMKSKFLPPGSLIVPNGSPSGAFCPHLTTLVPHTS